MYKMASSESLEYSTISDHIADINQIIATNDLSTYASELLQARIITPPSYDTVIAFNGANPRDKIASLTAEAMNKIKRFPNLFDELINILAKRDYSFASMLNKQCRGECSLSENPAIIILSSICRIRVNCSAE